MIESDQRRAVGDAPPQGDLARSLQRTLRRQLGQAVAVTRHPVRIAAVAAPGQSAQFARATGVVGLTVSEIESRPDEAVFVGAAVALALPFRVS